MLTQAQTRAEVQRLKLKQRVLIADDDTHFARRFQDYLWSHGFDVRIVRTISEAKESVQFWRPNSVFVNLHLPETTALSLVKFIHSRGLNVRPRVIVMSKQAMPQAVEQLRKAGAQHYLLKPFSLEDAVGIAASSAEEAAGDAARMALREAAANTGPNPIRELHLLDLILKQATLESTAENRWCNLMPMINMKTKALRSSLIQYINDDMAVVVASNDNFNVTGLPINLIDYPEILEVKNRHKALIIPDVKRAEILQKCQAKLRRTPFETIVLFPIYRHGRFFGVLSLRLEQKDALDIFYIEKFGAVCAQIISMALGMSNEALYRD